MKEEKRAKVRRERVEMILKDGQRFVHDVCDLAMPSPDGRFFVVRDLSAGEHVGRKGDSVDHFYPTDTVGKVVVTQKQFYIGMSGAREEEVLDNEPQTAQIIGQEEKI